MTTSLKSVAQKLLIRPGVMFGLTNVPTNIEVDSWNIPEDAKQSLECPDVIVGFASDKAELDSVCQKGVSRIKVGGILWICYPKSSSGVATDINRDKGWDVMERLNWHAVSQVSVDDRWSALRFRPRVEIAVMTRKF